LTAFSQCVYNVIVQQLASATNLRQATAEEVSEQILEVNPLLTRRIRAEMRSRTMPGLSMPQFRALGFLRHHSGSSLNDVAEHLGLTAPTASKLVQKLVLNKVVVRRVAEDRRRVCLSVTELGATALRKARVGTRHQLAESLGSLSQEDLSITSAALRVLGRAFSQGGGNVNLS